MWIKSKPERTVTGMTITPLVCSKCKAIWRYLDKLDSRCMCCGQINDLILNEDGSMDTTELTEDELDEIAKLQKENRKLRQVLALLVLQKRNESEEG
jgi:hypothetical protein